MIPTNPKFAKFLPNGTILFILANRDSIAFDYNTNTAKPLAPPAPFHASLANMAHSFSCPCSLQSSLSVAEIMVCGSACLNLSAQSARLALPYVAGSWLQIWLKDNAHTPPMHHGRHNPPPLSRSSHILMVLNRG